MQAAVPIMCGILPKILFSNWEKCMQGPETTLNRRYPYGYGCREIPTYDTDKVF